MPNEPKTNAFPDTADALSKANLEITETYDKQIYTSNAFPFCSPAHLRSAAYLWGLDTPPIENARILELGCAGGGNLLPFAVAYPNAKVVGVDLSSVQVSQGQEIIAALGLENLQLHAMSLTDITPEFGQFDYIVAHGVFSWVPPEVREAIMRIMRENMSADGIGYISYNTYPGWKAGDIVRDAMLLHSHSVEDKDKLAASKAILKLLSDGIATNNPLAPSLLAAVTQLQKHSDYYITHEYLEIFNSPCYLLEFASMADQHSIVHIGDAEPHVELSAAYGQNVQLNHSLVALGQPRIIRQQYLDFAVGRNFRKSLVVHSDRADQIHIGPNLDHLVNLRWAGHYTESIDDSISDKRIRSFRNHKGKALHTSDAAIPVLLDALTAVWPRSLCFDELVEYTKANLPAEQISNEATTRKTVLSALQTLFKLNSLRYTLEPTPYDTAASDNTSTVPRMIPGFSLLFRMRQDSTFGIGTYNLWHEVVNLSLKEAEVFVLEHMDGQRNQKQLTHLLRDALSSGKVPNIEGKSLKGQRNLDPTADKIVRRLIELLKHQGLLL